MHRTTKAAAKIDDPRRESWDSGLLELEAVRQEATRPGYYGRLELVLQDGFVEAVRHERIRKLKRAA